MQVIKNSDTVHNNQSLFLVLESHFADEVSISFGRFWPFVQEKNEIIDF